jgi:hypothetical protein
MSDHDLLWIIAVGVVLTAFFSFVSMTQLVSMADRDKPGEQAHEAPD